MQPGQSSLLTRILATVAGMILLVVGFMFSLVLLAVIAVAGLVALGWFWWKTRELRKTMKQHPADGHVIDGEAIVIDEYRSVRIVNQADSPDKPD
jgi:UPF0716 family protein affecting phage T7 exclusion